MFVPGTTKDPEADETSPGFFENLKTPSSLVIGMDTGRIYDFSHE